MAVYAPTDGYVANASTMGVFYIANRVAYKKSVTRFTIQSGE